ncbi:hypothetical protein BDQ12DRAFT_728874 [Crucibulum laeve]|uniref:Uncharacterized protein n=1 Tax=Crucibulum laeve TaxID=68775 RepID=A0A5C3LGF0_9AGAR|nr:hypothetical protein BDQ12DRAFT_728874 [Crucibulum laeve]
MDVDHLLKQVVVEVEEMLPKMRNRWVHKEVKVLNSAFGAVDTASTEEQSMRVQDVHAGEGGEVPEDALRSWSDGTHFESFLEVSFEAFPGYSGRDVARLASCIQAHGVCLSSALIYSERPNLALPSIDIFLSDVDPIATAVFSFFKVTAHALTVLDISAGGRITSFIIAIVAHSGRECLPSPTITPAHTPV